MGLSSRSTLLLPSFRSADFEVFGYGMGTGPAGGGGGLRQTSGIAATHWCEVAAPAISIEFAVAITAAPCRSTHACPHSSSQSRPGSWTQRLAPGCLRPLQAAPAAAPAGTAR